MPAREDLPHDLPDLPSPAVNVGTWRHFGSRSVERSAERSAVDEAISEDVALRADLEATYKELCKEYREAYADYERAADPEARLGALVRMKECAESAVVAHEVMLESREHVEQRIHSWAAKEGFGQTSDDRGIVSYARFEGRNADDAVTVLQNSVYGDQQRALESRGQLVNTMNSMLRLVDEALKELDAQLPSKASSLPSVQSSTSDNQSTVSVERQRPEVLAQLADHLARANGPSHSGAYSTGASAAHGDRLTVEQRFSWHLQAPSPNPQAEQQMHGPPTAVRGQSPFSPPSAVNAAVSSRSSSANGPPRSRRK